MAEQFIQWKEQVKIMRIAYICGYDNSASGGVQNMVPEYLKNMSECAEVSILSLGGAGLSVPRRVRVLDSAEELLERDRQPDLAVFHEIYYVQYYLLARKLHARHIPYVIIPHGSLTRGAQSQKAHVKKAFNFLWVNKFVDNAAAVQFLSDGEKESSIYRDKQCLVIPNGIRMTEKCKSFEMQKKGMKLVFIGRLSIFYKGLDCLIDACRLIKDEMLQKNIFLDIYGTDFENGRSQLENLIEKFELKKCVAIHRGIFGGAKEKALLDSDVFIQTSRYEGQPVGILEALQLGLPLIATPGTTFGDIAESRRCGWKVDGDAESISAGILWAYGDKTEWRMFGQNARDLTHAEYSWAAVREKTMREYNNLLGN